MSPDLFIAEEEATRSLMELYEQAKKCQVLYERANMSLPEPLRRLLGMTGVTIKAAASQIPPPDRPSAPPEAGHDWIWIKASDATPTAIVLAILRGAKGPVRHKDIVQGVTEILPEVPGGTISNVGTRLDGEVIRRTEEGWELVRPEIAGILYKGNLWGRPEIFGKYELAAHRRDAILHILESSSTGLQTLQILGEIQKCSWVHAPINKDLLKEDMEFLQRNEKVKKKAGGSKKWGIAVPRESKTT